MLRLTLLWEFPECKFWRLHFGGRLILFPWKKELRCTGTVISPLYAHTKPRNNFKFQKKKLPMEKIREKSCELACLKREAVLDTSGILVFILVLRFLKYSSESSK